MTKSINEISSKRDTEELIPIIAQDVETGRVRMVGVGNQESIAVSSKTGNLTFWSRTKGRLWTKGEESRDYLRICSKRNVLCISANNTLQNSVLYQVQQIIGSTGMTCHKGTPTCFGEDEFGISNRLILKQLDYAKMNGKILVITQAVPSNQIVGSRMLDKANVEYLIQSFTERSGGLARIAIDCDKDTLLVRVPMITISTSLT